MLQQSRTTPLVSMQGFDADERQVPMRLARPVMFRLFKDCAYVGLLLASNAFCNNRLKRLIIAVNTRWKPERYARAIGDPLRCSCVKRACAKGSEQSRDMQ
jgi:hypothetical protein